MLCSKQSCANIFHQHKTSGFAVLFCKQSMDTSHLEKLSCPVCWEKNPYFDTEAKYQKLFIQPALAMSSAGSSLTGWMLCFTFPLKAGSSPPVLGCTFVSEGVADKQWESLSCDTGQHSDAAEDTTHTIHLVSTVMLCHWQNPDINTQLIIWLCPEEKKIDSPGDFTVQ